MFRLQSFFILVSQLDMSARSPFFSDITFTENTTALCCAYLTLSTHKTQNICSGPRWPVTSPWATRPSSYWNPFLRPSFSVFKGTTLNWINLSLIPYLCLNTGEDGYQAHLPTRHLLACPALLRTPPPELSLSPGSYHPLPCSHTQAIS